jgi:hypothetical protein
MDDDPKQKWPRDYSTASWDFVRMTREPRRSRFLVGTQAAWEISFEFSPCSAVGGNRQPRAAFS